MICYYLNVHFQGQRIKTKIYTDSACSAVLSASVMMGTVYRSSGVAVQLNMNFFLHNVQGSVHRKYILIYEGNSISKLQIQVATYVFELSARNCHR